MSSCYCDYDQPEFYRQKVVKVRKVHCCDECGCDVRPGEECEVFVGKWDGVVSTYRTCERCLAFRRWYDANRPCFCWCFGGLFEAVRDDIDNCARDMRTEAPGFMFEAGRKYIAIRNRARADRRARSLR